MIRSKLSVNQANKLLYELKETNGNANRKMYIYISV